MSDLAIGEDEIVEREVERGRGELDVAIGEAGSAQYHLHLVKPFCVVKAVTGRPCPGCGITRGLLAILRGDLRRAWHLNPASFAVLLFFAHAAATAAGESLGTIAPERAAARRLVADRILLASLLLSWLTKL
jgi:hypothetical protein